MTKAQKNKTKLNGYVSVLDYGADKTGVSDSSAAFTAALAASKKVYIPSGSYRLNSTVALPASSHLIGDGISTSISVYGVNAFSVAAGVNFVTVEAMGLFSNSALGVADPRTFTAIQCSGTNPSNVNYVTLRDLYLQGWNRGVYWAYTWNSRIENVTTINTNDGVYLFGQSVNNSITGCRLVSNGGNSSINLQPDGSTVGEGLMVSDSLLASGTYGILTGLGFLSMNVSNCTIDLITGDGIRSTDAKDLRVSNCWVYATNAGVRLLALGTVSNQGVSLTGNTFQVTSSTGRCIEQNGANIGLSIVGNHFKHAGTSTGVYLDGQSAVVSGNYFENTGSGNSVFINSSASTHRVIGNTGTLTIGGGTLIDYSEGNWTVTDQSGASLSLTSNAQATWVKHGKMVTCTLDIRYPTTSNVSTARLSLPFQPETGASPSGCIGFQDVTGQFQVSGSTVTPTFVFWKAGASGAYATNQELSGGRFQISFTYRATT